MADSAFKNIERWAAAALCAVVASIAYAQPPHGRGAAPHGPGRPAFGAAPRSFVMTTDPYRHGGTRVAPAPAVGSAGIPLRPVSDHARALPREGGAAYVRAGSLRADIARYNEEREAGHVPRPPATGARSSEESPPVYRN